MFGWHSMGVIKKMGVEMMLYNSFLFRHYVAFLASPLGKPDIKVESISSISKSCFYYYNRIKKTPAPSHASSDVRRNAVLISC